MSQECRYLTVGASPTPEMAMSVNFDFALLAGSQQLLGVMRPYFTQVRPMGPRSIQDTKDADQDMDLDTKILQTGESEKLIKDLQLKLEE